MHFHDQGVADLTDDDLFEVALCVLRGGGLLSGGEFARLAFEFPVTARLATARRSDVERVR